MQRITVFVLTAWIAGCNHADSVAQTLSAHRIPLSINLRIGAADGPSALTRIGGAVEDDVGRIFVLQPQEKLVRVFDRRGLLLAKIGQQGDGPGEFRNPTQLHVIGDNLWIVDPSSNRISVFKDTGVETFNMQNSQIISRQPLDPIGLLADSSILLAPRLLTSEIANNVIQDQVVYRFSLQDTLLAVVTSVPIQHHLLSLRKEVGIGGMGLFGSQPFNDDPLFAPSFYHRGAIVVERYAPAAKKPTSKVRVVALRSTTDTIFDAAFVVSTTDLTTDEIDRAVDEWVEAAVGSMSLRPISPGQARKLVIRGLYRPSYAPSVRAVVVGDDGKVWLRGPHEANPDSVRWDVLSARGKSLGHVYLSASAMIVNSHGKSVLLAERDSLDLPYLVRAELK